MIYERTIKATKKIISRSILTKKKKKNKTTRRGLPKIFVTGTAIEIPVFVRVLLYAYDCLGGGLSTSECSPMAAHECLRTFPSTYEC